jgi:type II secretory pathway pseudopilin PulG
MKNSRSLPQFKKAITLLEMTIVILVILTLIGISVPSTRWVSGWKLGKQASEDLRAVYAAQRMYISDNPLVNIGTENNTTLRNRLAGYLPPTYGGVMPTIKADNGTTNLFITVNRTPPIVSATDGSATAYDPSNKPTDGLWDVGDP